MATTAASQRDGGEAASSSSTSNFTTTTSRAGATSTATGATGATAGAAPRTGTGASSRASAPVSMRDPQTFLFLANSWVMVMAVIHLFPFTPHPLAQRAYRFALLGAIIAYSTVIYNYSNRPARMNSWGVVSAWLKRVAGGNDAQYMYYCLLFLTSPPMGLVLIPILISATFNAASFCARNFDQLPLWRNYGSKYYGMMRMHATDALVVNASAEIALGFSLIFRLLTPSRSLVLLLAYWMFLKMRYRSTAGGRPHGMVWSQINMRSAPYLQRVPPLQRAVAFVQRWFLAS